MSLFYQARETAPSHTVRFVVPEKAWSRLQMQLARPGRRNSGIAKLFSQPSAFGCETDENPAKEPG